MKSERSFHPDGTPTVRHITDYKLRKMLSSNLNAVSPLICKPLSRRQTELLL